MTGKMTADLCPCAIKVFLPLWRCSRETKPASSRLCNLNVCVPECGSLGTRL